MSRGYLDRNPNPDDRRRIALKLTARGEQVVTAVQRGADAVDAQLRQRISAEQVHAMRSGLLALAEIKTTGIATGAALPRQRRLLERFDPIFPVADLAGALSHYSALGFKTFAYEDGEEYGFANREGVSLHLTRDPGRDPTRNAGSAYLNVRDADALYEEWSQPGIGGSTRSVGPTPYGMREGSHIDPDGNLIRFGSPAQ